VRKKKKREWAGLFLEKKKYKQIKICTTNTELAEVVKWTLEY
jgi:hypothetical protein